MTRRRPAVLLLDLGRVLLDIDFERCLAHWAGAATARGEAVEMAELRARFARDAAFAAHERGEIACDRFFDDLTVRLGLALPREIMRDGWNAIFGPDVPGLVERLDALAAHCELHVLSNTNATHAAYFRERHRALLAPVGRIFASHELGMRKPEARIYDRVVAELDVDPADVLFLDDDRANIDGAAARGLRTLHVDGTDRTCAALDAILAAEGMAGG